MFNQLILRVLYFVNPIKITTFTILKYYLMFK